MSDLWKTRTPPNPLKYGDFANDAESATERNGSGSLPDQKVWNLRECTNVFAVALNELQKEYSSLAIDDHLVWDKDDKYAMDFVAACANVRAHIFHIGLKSRFEVKCKFTWPISNGIEHERIHYITQIFSYFLQLWPVILFQLSLPQMQLQPVLWLCAH